MMHLESSFWQQIEVPIINWAAEARAEAHSPETENIMKRLKNIWNVLVSSLEILILYLMKRFLCCF